MPLKRVALYVRVSTTEQDTGRQEDDLRIEVLRAGNESVSVVYRDTMSGGVIRPGFQEMMADARQHKFDKLRVWSLDRFSREGVLKTLTHLKRLADLGIEFSSLAEPILDTSDEMTRDIVLSIIAAIAESYRRRVRENTISGLKRAVANGKTLGRKKGSKDKSPRRKSGYNLRWQKEPKKRVKKGT
jgi:DNA invertase Pin-like site-specific DNA recombinase